MPQLDKATFLSQLITTAFLLIIIFCLFTIVILPELYKAQRVRFFSFGEAEWEAYVVSTVFALIEYTNRCSLVILTNGFLDAIDAIEVNTSSIFAADESDEFVDDIDLSLEEEVSTDSYAVLNDEIVLPGLGDLIEQFGIYYNYNLEYFDVLVNYSLGNIEVFDVNMISSTPAD